MEKKNYLTLDDMEKCFFDSSLTMTVVIALNVAFWWPLIKLVLESLPSLLKKKMHLENALSLEMSL